ncbi:MAG: O-antigen ligase family protein [bacterium]
MPILVLTLFAALGSFSRWGLESAIWALLYVVYSGWIIFDLRRLLLAPLPVYLVLAFPLLALISTFWSLDPEHTFRISFHLFMTVVMALWIGITFSSIQVFMALLVASTVGLLLSYAVSVAGLAPVYSEADHFFIGIFTQKNVFGRLVLLLALSLLVVGIYKKKLWITWPVACFLIWPMLAIQSATSTVFLLLTLLFPLVVWASSGSKFRFQSLVLAALGVAALGIGVLSAVDISVISPLLSELGKDTTLTGRTYLWEVALKVFQENPLLGMGFDAFWHAKGVEGAREIWSQFGKLMGFHNTFLETLVGLGSVGLVTLIITLASFLVSVGRWVAQSRSVESMGALYFIVITVLMSLVEIISFREFDVFYLLPCSFFVIAVRSLRKSKGFNES